MWNYAKTNVSSKKPFVTETIMSLFDKGLSLTKLDRVFRISAVHQPFLHFDLSIQPTQDTFIAVFVSNDVFIYLFI